MLWYRRTPCSSCQFWHPYSPVPYSRPRSVFLPRTTPNTRTWKAFGGAGVGFSRGSGVSRFSRFVGIGQERRRGTHRQASETLAVPISNKEERAARDGPPGERDGRGPHPQTRGKGRREKAVAVSKHSGLRLGLRLRLGELPDAVKTGGQRSARPAAGWSKAELSFRTSKRFARKAGNLMAAANGSIPAR
jgi:hypothetical protein